MSRKCTEKRWVVIGECGVYPGHWASRKQAIDGHVKNMFSVKSYIHGPAAIQAFWEIREDLGDKVVLADIVYSY